MLSMSYIIGVEFEGPIGQNTETMDLRMLLRANLEQTKENPRVRVTKYDAPFNRVTPRFLDGIEEWSIVKTEQRAYLRRDYPPLDPDDPDDEQYSNQFFSEEVKPSIHTPEALVEHHVQPEPLPDFLQTPGQPIRMRRLPIYMAAFFMFFDERDHEPHDQAEPLPPSGNTLPTQQEEQKQTPIPAISRR